MSKQDTRIEDDADLWARIAETATPLKNRNRVARMAAPLRPAASRTIKPKAKSAATSRSAPLLGPPRPSYAPQTGLDRQTARKLNKGHLAVEARLDLHGMRQRDAHAALRKFLAWARSKDYRHVLVITGKGSLRESSASFYEEEERGVLRQAVPHWLGHGDLAPLIVSFSEAPRRLGGAGALYVRLKKALGQIG
jgi:DNA-nicking Smr family endonuclease